MADTEHNLDIDDVESHLHDIEDMLSRQRAPEHAGDRGDHGGDEADEGQPSQIMVQSDFSVVPSAVWGYSDSNTQANTMGQRQVDAADDAELASIK